MHSQYNIPHFKTVDEMAESGDEVAILAKNIFAQLDVINDLSYEQKEKAIHLANEMLFEKLVTSI